MPARAVAQLGMDEQTIADPEVEAALEARQRAKNSLDAVRVKFDEADEKAKAELTKLELPDGAAARVGRFRITKTYIPARSVEPFETKASSRTRITLVEGEGVIDRAQGAKAAREIAQDDADLRPKGKVDTTAIRNAASLN